MDTIFKMMPSFLEYLTGPNAGVFVLGMIFGAALMYAFHARVRVAEIQRDFEKKIAALDEVHRERELALRDELQRLRERFSPIEEMMHKAFEATLTTGHNQPRETQK